MKKGARRERECVCMLWITWCLLISCILLITVIAIMTRICHHLNFTTNLLSTVLWFRGALEYTSTIHYIKKQEFEKACKLLKDLTSWKPLWISISKGTSSVLKPARHKILAWRLRSSKELGIKVYRYFEKYFCSLYYCISQTLAKEAVNI